MSKMFSPQIRLLIAHAILSLGDGLWLSIWAIYITTILGIPPRQMGYIVAIGGISGMLASYPAGALADRFDSRKVAAALASGRAISLLIFMNTTTVFQLAVPGALVFGLQSALGGIKTTMAVSIFSERSTQLKLLGRMRVIQHVCNAIGMIIGSYFLYSNAWPSYAVAISIIALSQFVYTAIVYKLPNDQPVTADNVVHSSVSRDYPYIVVMAVSGLLALCWPLLSTAMPLWIKTIPVVPTYYVSYLLAFSAIGIALFQIKVSSRIQNLRESRWAVAVAGIFLSVGAVVFGLAGTESYLLSVILLFLGCACVTAGELVFIASRWVLSIELMAIQSAKGRYQGIVAATEGIVLSAGPLIMVSVVSWDFYGWFALGTIFMLAGVSTPSLISICISKRSWSETRPGRTDHV